MKEAIEFSQEHGPAIMGIITGLYELAVRIWPTSKNLSIIDKVIKIISFIIPNRSTKTTFINVEGSDIKETSKHIIKMIVFFVLFSISTYAQTNVTGKSFRSYNADSLTVRTEVSGLQLMYGDIGALYYNKQSSKWRIFSDSTWSDLGIGGGGSGGAFWPLAGTGNLTDSVLITGAVNLKINTDTTEFINSYSKIYSPSIALGISDLTDNSNIIIYVDNANDFSYQSHYTNTDNFTANARYICSSTEADLDLFSTNNLTSASGNISVSTASGVEITQSENTGSSRIELKNGNIDFLTGTNINNYTNKLNISNTGVFTVANFVGVGSRMVVADASGVLGTAAIPSGGGITNTAAANEMAKSDGTNLVPSGVFSTTAGDLTFGTGLAGTTRTLRSESSGANASLILIPKGSSSIFLQPTTGSVEITNTGTTGTRMFGITSSGTSGSSLTFTSGTNNPLLEGGGGSSFTVKAFDASAGGNGLILKGGNATSGNNNGGNVTISGGALSGTGVNGYIVLQNLPTSCSGAPTGALANIAGVLNVCP